MCEAQNALKKVYSKLPPGIVLQNQKDNRHPLVEKVEDRGRYLSIEGRIISRDGGLKKKRQHLYQLAQEWIPMTYMVVTSLSLSSSASSGTRPRH